jgi:hypothetical protein
MMKTQKERREWINEHGDDNTAGGFYLEVWYPNGKPCIQMEALLDKRDEKALLETAFEVGPRSANRRAKGRPSSA